METDSAGFASLEEVIDHELYPDVDLALRRGVHIGREDAELYEYLADAQDLLEPFYRRFSCELMQRTDGYFYLLPSGERLGSRRLSKAEMLVGQCLALLYLDPSTLNQGGVVDRNVVLHRLEGLVGVKSLWQILSPQSKRYNERKARDTICAKVDEAFRRLTALGFIKIPESGFIQLRPALMRFADPIRSHDDQAAAMERLVVQGEVVFEDDADGGDEAVLGEGE